MNLILPNYKELNNEDGKIYGGSNVVTGVNPYNCYFIATYPNGKKVFGRNLFQTGWDDTPQGLCKLEYFLSTGHLIEIPLYKAYKPLIECSVGVDGSRVFHHINVQCLDEKSVVIDKIILKKDLNSKYNIGDRIISRNKNLPKRFDTSWKFTSSY